MLNAEAVARIIEHMNADHADAVLLYVRAFAGQDQATSAQMVDFDAHGMGIDYLKDGGRHSCRVEFAQPLADAGEARAVLVAMVGEARDKLGMPATGGGH